MITRLSLIFITLFFTLLPIFSQTKEEVKVELKFSIDTRFGLAKGLFRKSSLLIKDRKQGTGIVEIDVASIDTNNSMRDNHLRDEDFFSVQKFPKAEFEILSLTESSADTVSGNGKLTLKGISKEYTFQGTIKINRRDYGMVYQSLINPIEDIANLEFTVTLPLKK